MVNYYAQFNYFDIGIAVLFFENFLFSEKKGNHLENWFPYIK